MKQDKQQKTKTKNNNEETFKEASLAKYSVFMWLITVLLTFLAAFLYKKTQGEIIKILIFSMIGSLVSAVSYAYGAYGNRFLYDNQRHPGRFFFVYSVSLILSLMFPLMNHGGWAFMCLAVSLTLFSDSFTGLICVSTLLMDTCLLYNGNSSEAFFVYFISSYVSILLFKEINENFEVGKSLFVSLLLLFVLETAGFIFLENEELNFEQFIMPLVNILVNAIVMFWCLKFYSDRVVNKFRNKYLEINDQEYKALLDLKEKSKEDYFRSIHTAYLVERIAGAIGCDVFVSKNCAYYHRIKNVYNFTQAQCVRFCRDNDFPPEAEAALIEYFDKKERPVKKESCIVYLSDNLIGTLQKVFSKNSQAKIDYNELIDALFDKNYINEALQDSDLTRKDYRIIKDIMKKETLYYDFLR